MDTSTRLLAVACAAGLLAIAGCDSTDSGAGRSAPPLRPLQGAAAEAALTADLEAVAKAMEGYKDDHGRFPRRVLMSAAGAATLGRGVAVPLTVGITINGGSTPSGRVYCLVGSAMGVRKVQYYDSTIAKTTFKRCAMWSAPEDGTSGAA